MDFKDVSIDDKDVLAPYLRNNKYGISDFSFAEIFMWNHHFTTSYVMHKNALLMRIKDFYGVPHFMMPLGLPDCQLKLYEIISDMVSYSKSLNEDFRMISLTAEMLDELNEVMPENFIKSFTVAPPLYWDYLYLSEDLITLKGKKFHQKRNHINKFDSLYDYEYIDLTHEHVGECIRLIGEWVEANDSDDPYIQLETISVTNALNNFDALGLIGGVLLIDGKTAGFTFGEMLNDKVFVVLVEKALYQYNGIYSKINNEFAKRNCGNFAYINREDDWGLDGLRKAKMSYNPVLLLEKHTGILNGGLI